MSKINQKIRYAPYDGENLNNPHNLYEFIKPSRIEVGNANPDPDQFTYFDYYINATTGDLFFKDRTGVWNLIYNFPSGGGGSGITNIENDSSPGLFKFLTGATAHFKGLGAGLPNQIFVDGADPNTILLSMEPSYKPESLDLLENFPLQTGIGSGTFSPNGVVGIPEGYNNGSLFVQVSGTPQLWICINAATKVWKVFAFDGEILNINNVGAGEELFIQPINGVAGMRTLTTTPNTVKITEDTPNTLNFDMQPTYKPTTLSLVDNKKNTQGAVVPPTSSDDNTLGYTIGSLWTTPTDVYLCSSAATGAAIWKDIVAGVIPEPKDYINWTNNAGYIHNPAPDGSIQDWDAGADGNIITRVTSTPSVWSHAHDGTRILFTKGTTSGTKAYRVDFSVIANDFLAARTDTSRYEFFFKRKADDSTLYQSTCGFTLGPTSEASGGVWGWMSHSFIIKETVTTPIGYYVKILATRGVAPAQNIFIDRWSLAISEI